MTTTEKLYRDAVRAQWTARSGEDAFQMAWAESTVQMLADRLLKQGYTIAIIRSWRKEEESAR